MLGLTIQQLQDVRRQIHDSIQRFHRALHAGGGMQETRDTRETSDIQFPVLSKGRYCKDTRRRGIVTSKNRSVVIDGVTIRKNDLIFADRDGIVVIPRAVEHEVMERALKAMADERRILVDIAQGADTGTLVQRYGFF